MNNGGEKVSKRIWELKQNADVPEVLELYIYGDIEGDYYDWWLGKEIKSDTSANHFKEELAKYPDIKEIKVFINSYGGSVFEATAIYSQLKRHEASITVYIDGFACSAASVIAMAGDKVIMPKNTMMMIHNMWTCACGNAKELRKAADDLDSISEGNRQAYLMKANETLTEEKLIEMMDAETWLTAEQCLSYGFADEVSEKEVDLKDSKEMLQKVNKTFEQKLSYNKALAAQLKEMIEVPKQEEPVKSTEPVEPVEGVQNKENKVMKMVSALLK